MSTRARTLVSHRKKWLSSHPKNRDRPFTQSPLAKGAARLYGKLKDLGTKEHEPQASGSIFQCNGTATDIFSLPVELLTDIFLMAYEFHGSIFARTSIPVNLTQTCRLWRAIALGTPILWSEFSLSQCLSPDNLQLWISRANGLPLTLLGLEAGYADTPRRALRESRLWAIMSLHAAQLEHLHFMGTFAHPTFLDTLQPGMFSSLKSVEWLTTNSGDDPLTAENYEAFWATACSAPLLRKVQIEEIPRMAPWSQLTDLTLSHSPFLPAIRALWQCQNLAKLDWFDAGYTESMEPILLPKLVDFTVSCGRVRGPGTMSVLEYLSLPSLSRLTVEFCDDMLSMLESVHMLLARCNAELEHFEVPWIVHTETTTFVEFLTTPLLHNLRYLTVKYYFESPGDFCKMLETPSFLPYLEELHLQIPIDFDTNLNIFGESFQKRKSTGHSIQLQIFISRYDFNPFGSPPSLYYD